MRTLLLTLSLLAPIETLDVSVQQAVQASRRPGLEKLMRTASNVSKPVALAGLAAFALVNPVAGVTTARIAVVTLIPVNLVVEGLKRTVGRTRPDGDRDRDNSSFPSSHAANAFAVAAVLALRWRRIGIAALLVAALIAYSRMYLNRHFLSDVVFGAGIGVVCAWAVTRWGDRLAVRAPAPNAG